MKRHNSAIELPQAFVPLLSARGVDGFIAKMEGNRLVFEPKPATSKTVAKKAAVAQEKGEDGGRPKFRYLPKDKRKTPELAKRYGLSPTRTKVYRAIYASKNGLLASDIMNRCKLSHGSVQQTLNWLRGHDFVAHEVEAA